jgi:uncharacterized protein YjbJ (UPF0337 family)
MLPLARLSMRRNHCRGLRFTQHSQNPSQRKDEMNWDTVAGNWKQMKGKAKQKWAKLTDDDLTYIDGKRDQLIGRIQERYGVQKDIAEKQLKEWEGTL